MYKTIKDIDLKDKTVILRVDYNVPMKDRVIVDDTRIVKSLDTIKYLLNNNCKIVILSHLGKVKTDDDRIKNSLRPICIRLAELINQKVIFVEDYLNAKKVVKKAENKSIIMLENTRWYDYPDKLESKCDKEFTEFLASLGEIFINDAFGTIHRKHASNYGISSLLPSAIGYLVEKEINELNKLNNPNKPYVVILGGSKVSDKTLLVEKFAKDADYVLIAGGLSLTFLKALGCSIGNSKCEDDLLEFCLDIIRRYKDKIVLPIDFVCNSSFTDTKGETYIIGEIPSDQMCLDIGPKTIDNFKKYLKDSKTILWNGPLGVYEFKNYQTGTKEILNFIKDINSYKVLGGGDIVSACNNLGFNKYINHISTGGGATLSFLQGDELPGLINIEEGN